MKRTSAESAAKLTVERLKKLKAPEQLRQIQIILKAEKPFTVLRSRVERQHILAKAAVIRAGLPPRKRGKRT